MKSIALIALVTSALCFAPDANAGFLLGYAMGSSGSRSRGTSVAVTQAKAPSCLVLVTDRIAIDGNDVQGVSPFKGFLDPKGNYWDNRQTPADKEVNGSRISFYSKKDLFVEKLAPELYNLIKKTCPPKEKAAQK